MRLKTGQDFSYCMNVHPGEGVEDIRAAVMRAVPDIRKTLCPDAPFGLGLRVASEAALALQTPKIREEFAALLADQNLYAFTINGFPYGAFHQTRVKQNVYLPDWASTERFTYTCHLFSFLSAILPEEAQGSVSTVPLGYRFASTRPEQTIEPLREIGRFLARVEAESGKQLHLGLEPEPDCLLETTDETIRFFEDLLFAGTGSEEEQLRRHLGVCLDTCHVAMQFEDPADSLRAYRKKGIRVSKVQLSAALECPASLSPEMLQPFDDGVYLHQVKGRSSPDHSAPDFRWADLPEWLDSPATDAETIRIHAHVPLHWEGDADLGTTRSTLTEDFWNELAQDRCPHIEVETYTFDVLPGDVRAGQTVTDDMSAECQWALQKILT